MTLKTSYPDDLQVALEPLLSLWGLGEGATLRLLTVSENATFLAEDPLSACRLILRVHRPGYTTKEEITSELDWLNALTTHPDIHIGAPAPLLDGSYIADVTVGDITTQVVAFYFVPGSEPALNDDLCHWYYRLGQSAAHLHCHSEQWERPVGFRRRSWRFDTIIGAQSAWGDWRDLQPFTPQELQLLEDVETSVKQALTRYGESPQRFGLVHCDMRLANLLVDGDRLTVIDFDDCGLCWFGWDFATAVSFIEDDARIQEFCHAWVDGYRTVRAFSADDEAILPVLVMLRRLQLTAWIASHSETPTARDLRSDWGSNTIRLAREYLESARLNSDRVQEH